MAETEIELHDKGTNKNNASTASIVPSIKLPSHYQILSEIGRGGMGAVYRAFDSKLQREVAIKLLNSDAGDEQSAARFRQEAKELSSFTHPNIVALLDYGKSESEDYIVLEFCKGGNLLDWIAKKPSIAEIVNCFIAIAQGLDYIHNRGIVHRDLKPENILLTYEGQPRITDFGIARRLEENTRFTAAGTILGTSTYMAPEQIMSSEVGPAADIYSLGICLFEALTGAPPFVGNQHFVLLQAHLTEVPPSVRSKRPEVPEDLDRLVERMLKKDPEDRPSSAQEIIAALKDLHINSVADSLPTSSIERPKAYAELMDLIKTVKGNVGIGVHLLGPSGSGRSHLLKKLCKYAKTEGVQTIVLAPRPEPIDSLKQLWRDLAPNCPIQEILAIEGITGAANWIRRRLEDKLEPTILVCDDIERHCSTTLSVISALSLLTPPPSSGWVISSTPAQKIGGSSMPVIELSPMSSQDLDHIFQTIKGAPPTPLISDWLSSRSAGYPRQARLLAHTLTDPNSDPPRDLNQAAKQSLDSLSENSRLSLETISIAHQPASYELILAGSGLAQRSLDGALSELTKGGYIEEDWTNPDCFRICHDIYREILLQQLPSRTSRRLHLAMASYYEGFSETTLRGNHLLAAGSRKEAYPVLIKEADLAKDYGFFPLAHNLLKSAISCSDHPGHELAEGQGLLAEVALESGNIEESKKILQETTPQSLSSQLRVDLVWTALANKESQPLDESKLVTPKGANPATMKEVQLSLNLHRQLAKAASRQKNFDQAQHHIEQATKLASQLNESEAWSQVLITSGYIKLAQGDAAEAEAEARQAIEKSRSSENPRWKAKSFELLGEVQMALGEPSRAALSFQQALEISREALLDKRALELEQKVQRAQRGEATSLPAPESTSPVVNLAYSPSIASESKSAGSTAQIEQPSDSAFASQKPKSSISEPDTTLIESATQSASTKQQAPSDEPTFTSSKEPSAIQATAPKTDPLEAEAAALADPPPKQAAPSTKKRWILAIAAVLIVASLGGAAYYQKWLSVPGQLIITAHPEKLTLSINGEAPQSISSKQPIKLAPGTYTLKLEAEGYTSVDKSIQIERDTPLSLNVSLVATHGGVLFGKFPAGSVVTIDSSEDKSGIKSNQLISLPVGVHQIKITNGDLNKPWQTTIAVEPEKTTKLAIDMPRTKGDLVVQSVPDKARIILKRGKQEFTGITNTTMPDLAPGEYVLQLEKKGYYTTYKQAVTITAGQSTNLDVIKLDAIEAKPTPPEPSNTPPASEPPAHKPPSYTPPVYNPPVYNPPPAGGGTKSGSGDIDWK